MSEPITKLEIEDVLSSIRRLVSDKDRTQASPGPEVELSISDKLVLTPSQRVTGYEQSSENPSDCSAVLKSISNVAPGQDLATDLSATLTLTASYRTASYDQVAGEADHVTGDASGDAPENGVETGADARLLEAIKNESEMTQAADDDTGQEIEETRDMDDDNPVVSDVEAEEDTAPASGDDDDHDAEDNQGESPSGDGQDSDDEARNDANARSDAESEQAEEVESPPVAEDESQAGAVDHADMRDDGASGNRLSHAVDAERFVNADTLSAKIEALEAAIAETQDQWEPDGDSDDDYAGSELQTIMWRHRGQPALEEVPEQSEPAAEDRVETPDEPDGQDPDAVDTAELTLDEDMLRELVTDIIREELQGALGERITRNVRKLVRREIHRVLAMQELE